MNIFSNIGNRTIFLWVLGFALIIILIRLVTTFINYRILKSNANKLDNNYTEGDRYHRVFGTSVEYITFDKFKTIFPLSNKINISADDDGGYIDMLSKTLVYNQYICINDVFYVPETFADYLSILGYIDMLFIKHRPKKGKIPESVVNDAETTIKRIVEIFDSEINDIFILEYIPKKYGTSEPFIYYDTDNNDLYLYCVDNDLLSLLAVLTITKVSKTTDIDNLAFRTANELFNIVTTDDKISSYIVDDPSFFLADGIDQLISVFITEAPISKDFQTFLRENHNLNVIQNLWKSLKYDIENS